MSYACLDLWLSQASTICLVLVIVWYLLSFGICFVVLQSSSHIAHAALLYTLSTSEVRGSNMAHAKGAVLCTTLCCFGRSCHAWRDATIRFLLVGMYRLVAMWTVPEHVRVYLHGLHEYPIHPSVEVFVVGVILGQLVGCSLWPAGMTEASYWLMLSAGARCR